MNYRSKISQDAAKAFINFEPFKSSNTEVFVIGQTVTMTLHGNEIAFNDLIEGQPILLSNGGYYDDRTGCPSVTTKARLNAILDRLNKPLIYQKSFVWYRDIAGKQIEFEDGWNEI